MEPTEDFWTPARIASLTLVLLYAEACYLFLGAVCALQMLGACILPLFCVWFPHGMGNFTGSRITHPTPPIMISIGGWILLFVLPAAMLIRFLAVGSPGVLVRP